MNAQKSQDLRDLAVGFSFTAPVCCLSVVPLLKNMSRPSSRLPVFSMSRDSGPTMGRLAACCFWFRGRAFDKCVSLGRPGSGSGNAATNETSTKHSSTCTRTHTLTNMTSNARPAQHIMLFYLILKVLTTNQPTYWYLYKPFTHCSTFNSLAVLAATLFFTINIILFANHSCLSPCLWNKLANCQRLKLAYLVNPPKKRLSVHTELYFIDSVLWISYTHWF